MSSTTTGGLMASCNGSVPLHATLTIEREHEEVHVGAGVEPDPRWVFTDGGNHTHGAFQRDGVVFYPTLHARRVPCSGECGDPHHTEVEHYCPICREVVTPGVRATGPTVLRQPVRTRCTLRVSYEGNGAPPVSFPAHVWAVAADDRGGEMVVAGIADPIEMTSDGFVLAFRGQPGMRATRPA